MDNGVIDVDPTRPYYVIVYSFQQTAVHLPKHLCVGFIEPDFDPCADISEVSQEIIATVTGLDERIVTEKESNAAD